MLVIRRGRGDGVLIGDDIVIEILDIQSGQVKMGIRAPRHIPVLRREIVLTAEANRAASAASAEAVGRLLGTLGNR